ncbi:hypothetical protein JCM9279_000431 [Rhodotorula babjevae]
MASPASDRSTSPPVSSAGAHNLTPPTSTVTHDTTSSAHTSSTIGAKLSGAAKEVKGKLGGDAGAVDEGRRRRQGAGLRRDEDE